MTIGKITQDQALFYLEEAYCVSGKHECIRFGQALFNALPLDVTNHIRGTDQDFFYDTNHDTIYEKFFANCVVDDVNLNVTLEVIKGE